MNPSAIKIIIYSIIALVLLVMLLFLLSSDWLNNMFNFPKFNLFSGSFSYSNYANADKYSVGDTEVDSALVTTLDIDWISGQVDIITYDGTKIVVTETNTTSLEDEERLHYWLDNGKLNIKFCAPGLRSFKINNQHKVLQIKVPTDYATTLNINTVSADNSFADVAAKDVKINSVSGSVTGSFSGTLGLVKAGTVSGRINLNCAADKVDFNSVSGSLEFNGVATTIDLKTTSGALRINTENSPESIKAKSVSGSVKIFLPETAEFEAQFSTVSGTLRCEFPTVMLKKNNIKCGDGGINIDASTVSGSLDIKKR